MTTTTKTAKARKAAAPKAAVEEATPAPTPKPHKGKIGILLALLQREEGATLFEMSEATGWQLHSVRGAMAGSIKKKLGHDITSEKPGNERIYRIKSGDQSPASGQAADPA